MTLFSKQALICCALITTLHDCWSCPPSEGRGMTRKPNAQQLAETNVYFSNTSGFARPGLVRLPLLQKSEYNIFIEKSVAMHAVRLDQTSEFFYSGDSHIPYILSVGDTVIIKLNADNARAPYSLQSNSGQNERITIFQEAIKTGIPLYYTEQDNEKHKLLSRQEMMNRPAAIIKLLQSAQIFVASHSAHMGNDFKSYLADYLKFDNYIKLFTYCTERKIIDSLTKSNYFDFTIDRNNPYFNCNYAYYGALYQYFLYRYNNYNAVSDAPKVMAFIDDNFKKEHADIIRLFYLKNYGIQLLASKPAAFTNAVEKITEPGFKTYLSAVAQSFAYQKQVKNNMVSENGQTTGPEQVLNTASGSLTFVDFWASWCGPCREEFKNYDALLKTFASDKISFVTVSIDQDNNSWKKALKQEHFDPRLKNYFYPNPSAAKKAAFKLESIPRYCIIGKNGKVINNDAPRPSDSTLVPLLRSLLKM